MRACPVCKRPDLANGLEHCPQCNADLECFDLLDTLQEQLAGQAPASAQPAAVAERSGVAGGATEKLAGDLVPAAPRTGKQGLAIGISVVLPLTLLLLVALMALVGSRHLDARFDRLEDGVASSSSRATPSPEEWSQLLSSVQDLNVQLKAMEQGRADSTAERPQPAAFLPALAGADCSASAPAAQSHSSRPSATVGPLPNTEFSDYQAAPTETLWRISERFYGKGIYYPVLLEDNPGAAIYGPPGGQTLRIARQPGHAPETYRRLVHTEGGTTLFRYRPGAGDTWRSLARAFYGSERRAAELAELNGTPQPEPDQRVLVPLD